MGWLKLLNVVYDLIIEIKRAAKREKIQTKSDQIDQDVVDYHNNNFSSVVSDDIDKALRGDNAEDRPPKD